MVGNPIKKFGLGTRYLSKEILFQKNDIADISDLIYKSPGGPFIISEHGQSFVFYDDVTCCGR